VTNEDFVDLDDYDALLQATHKKIPILSDFDQSEAGESTGKSEKSDEFLRNFFIKFGMKKTLESFQSEWFELKTKGQLNLD